jgi:thioredoxin reductase
MTGLKEKIFLIILILYLSMLFFYYYFDFKKNTIIDTSKIYEYIIIGSGPAGLQTGYFLEKYKKDYIVLEKSSDCGSFFKKYPIHRKLISVNKVHTGSTNKDFNLRHDWNSLLSDDDSLLFKNYTHEFFPHADYMVNYLNDYQYKNKIKVSFNTNVNNINKLSNELFEINTSNGIIKCKKLIVATGLMKNNIGYNTMFPYKPYYPGCLNYKDITTDKTKFINKNICILGKGNTAFETANYLTDTAAVIQVFTKGPLNYAWDTHYPGHLRAINNDFLDVYNLKTQHSVNTLDYDVEIIVKKRKDKYFVFSDQDMDEQCKWISNEHTHGSSIDQHPEGGFDFIIDCTGFKIDTSMFGNIKPSNNGKVPYINGDFQSRNIDNLYFAGVLSQDISYKFGSAAFVHGFRHLISSMIKLDTNNLNIYHYSTIEQLNTKIIYRMNTAPGLFQMFNCLCDVIIFDNNKISYIEEVTIKYAQNNYITAHNKVIIFSLKYGNIFDINKKIDKKRKYGFGYIHDNNMGVSADYDGGIKETANLSHFIHPVFDFYFNNEQIFDFHLAEHLLGEFKLQHVHIEPLNDFLAIIQKYNDKSNIEELTKLHE